MKPFNPDHSEVEYNDSPYIFQYMMLPMNKNVNVHFIYYQCLEFSASDMYNDTRFEDYDVYANDIEQYQVIIRADTPYAKKSYTKILQTIFKDLCIETHIFEVTVGISFIWDKQLFPDKPFILNFILRTFRTSLLSRQYLGDYSDNILSMYKRVIDSTNYLVNCIKNVPFIKLENEMKLTAILYQELLKIPIRGIDNWFVVDGYDYYKDIKNAMSLKYGTNYMRYDTLNILTTFRELVNKKSK
jgi:hypothetical protein